jgi:hypothetical protein
VLKCLNRYFDIPNDHKDLACSKKARVSVLNTAWCCLAKKAARQFRFINESPSESSDGEALIAAP